MKKLSFLTIVCMAICLVSCGGNKENSNEETTQTIETEEYSSDYEDYSSDDEEYASDEEDDSYSSTDSEDWDDVLDSYEEYVDQYIVVMKKANKGDMNALNEMSSLMEKYQDLAEELDAAGDEMTASQMARYNKITMKIANAAM